MHLTLKLAATRPAAGNVRQPQDRFDDFIKQYNRERPYPPIEMKGPADLFYRPSPSPYKGLEEFEYPVSLTRLERRRDTLRPDLLQGPPNQPESGVCLAEGRRQAGRGPHLARQLHALRRGMFR